MRNKYPRQVPFIIANEAAERFSFYGMRNVLTIFLIGYLLANDGMSRGELEAEAKATFHLFVMGVYFSPLLGGYLADRYLGKYKTILYLSLVYTVGQFSLAFFSASKPGFYAGLFLVALGSGGIKPCVAAFVGDQFDQTNKHLVRNVFGLFYWIINFGSFFASLTIPWVLPAYGPRAAFGIPGVLMALSIVILWLGRSNYVNVPPDQGTERPRFWLVLFDAWRAPAKPGQGFLARASARHSQEALLAVGAVLKILPIFLLVAMFWAIFDQKASTVVVQARLMERSLFGQQIQESQMQALNPMLVMLLIPLTTIVYPWLERSGFKPTPLRRMNAGIALSGVAFALVGALQLWLDTGTRLHIGWQVAPYVVLTLAEVLVSATGLEFAYSQAPLSMKGVIMSLWNLTVALGNFLVVLVIKLSVFHGAMQIFFFAGLAFAASLAFWVLARRYTVVDHFRSAA